MRILLPLVAGVTLTGCITLPPSAESLARLPVVEFPNPAPTGDFILKLPAGTPIPLHTIVQGTLLTQPAESTLSSALKKDLYTYQQWASEDGKTWKPARDVVQVTLTLALPSDLHPKPGELKLVVDRGTQR